MTNDPQPPAPAPPADPLGEIDPATAPDETGCYAGCCGLAAALWALPVAAVAGAFVGSEFGPSAGWSAFAGGVIPSGLLGGWAAGRFAASRPARRRVAVGGGVVAVLFLLLSAWAYAAHLDTRADEPGVMYAGLGELLLCWACLPPAVGGAAAALSRTFAPPVGGEGG